MRSSPRAMNLIIEEETGGRVYYDKKERHPDWPGGRSGVTIGIGYDCGYETAAQIQADWGAVLNTSMLKLLMSVAGVHGSPAKALAHELAHAGVAVEWEQAMQVFERVDMPRWEAIVSKLPGSDKLSPDSFGALVSLAFNRGASWDIPASHDHTGRYREMRQIKADVADGNLSNIPVQIRSMKRLWPSTKDLRDRRDHEATLFEAGMAGPLFN